jgi:dihydroxyacetone kinase-like protein
VPLCVLERLTVSGTLTVDVLKAALVRVAAKMETSADELNELDAAFGDGDLGVTMVRGTRAIVSELAEFPDDMGMALGKCARAFTRTSGSTFGTLVATGFMAMGRITGGQRDIAWCSLPGLLNEALTAMSRRGKAQLGDKTMLDAVDGMRRGIEGREDPDLMLTAAVDEVRAVLDRLRAQPARQGRARIFADKTMGRDDPGMIVILRALEGLAQSESVE